MVAVLAQEGSRPAGGRRPPGDDGGLLVEGVAGFGDDFMLAGRPRPRCPSMGSTMSAGWGQRHGRLGPVRFEGPTSGHDAWVLRLQLATVAASATSVYPGVPSRWHRFDPLLGLQRLRNLIASVGRDEGIEVTGDVGVSSTPETCSAGRPSHPGWAAPPRPALNSGIRPRHVIMPRPLVVSNITIKA